MNGEDGGIDGAQFHARGGPVKNVNVDRAFLLCGAHVLQALEWSVGSSVDGFAVDCEPIADSAKSLLKLRLDDAVGLRTHVEKEVAAAACYFNQATNQKFGRFEVEIALVVSPR